jgi:mono/diheme cytochrome c family protein
MLSSLKTKLGLAEALDKKSVLDSWLSSEMLRRSAMFVDPSYIPLQTERANKMRGGYKHLAPPEQEPPPQIKPIFCARLLAGMFVISLLMGCNTRLPGQPTEAERWRPASDVSDFNELYIANCAGCHGSEGKLGAARPLNDPLYLSFVPEDALKEVISQGRQGTNMPAFSQQAGGLLTDHQIELLISGMRAAWSKPGGFKGQEIPSYSATATSGNAQSGASAYQTYCSSCHGPKGAGGSAGSIVDPNFLNLVSDQGLRTTVVVGRSDLGKPDWRSNLPGHPMSPQEIDAVVAWLAAQRQMQSTALARIR